MRALVLAIGLIAAPAVAADQFDLVCTAKKEVVRYRVDLTAGEWCFDKCERVMKIPEVTSGMLTLINEKPTLPDNVTAYNRINRVTGDWEWYNYSPRLSGSAMNVRGSCQRVDFTGFGDLNRKF